jgi:hypothetical protein
MERDMDIDGGRAARRRVAGAFASAVALALVTGAAQAAEGEKAAPAPKPPAPKPAESKATDKAPPAKAPDAKAAPAAPATPPGPGMWASLDDFMKRTGRTLEETRVLGMRIRPSLSESIVYTDNAFYQDDDEFIVADLDPPDDPTPGPANPKIEKGRGRVAEVVNIADLSVAFDIDVSPRLTPALGDGVRTLTVLRGTVTSIEYLRHGDSPDALNYSIGLDYAGLLNQALERLRKFDISKNAFWFRVEGDYSRVTDPLDAAKLAVSGSAAPNGTLFQVGEYRTFTREEVWCKPTIGWQGRAFDAKFSAKWYRFTVDDEDLLDTADHDQFTAYGEIGWTMRNSEHRFFGLYEWTDYKFDARGADPFSTGAVEVPGLRNYDRTKFGVGWQGPLLTKKLTMRLEGGYMYTDIQNENDAPFPILEDPTPTRIFRRFSEFHGAWGKGTLAYRPFAGKNTQLQAEYERVIDWSVVREYRIVDKGAITLTHPVNERLTGEFQYTIEADNSINGAKRLYQEIGVGAKYKVMAHTTLFARFTFRHMRSRNEERVVQADPNNQLFIVKANGDFHAAIVTVGVKVEF